VGATGALGGRAVNRGILTLPSGHILDALLVEHLLDTSLRAPASLCSVQAATLRQHVLEWIVPHLGTVAELRGPEIAPDLSWQEAQDAVVAHGLLPPLAVGVLVETPTSVTVSWDPGRDPRHVDAWVVHWGTVEGAPTRSSDLEGDTIPRGVTSYTIDGLAPATTYHVSVTSRSRYQDPRSGIVTTYDSIALPDVIGADIDGDGTRDTSYPPETEVRTRDTATALLRDHVPTLDTPLGGVLPLDPVADVHVASFPAQALDPDALVLADPGRPLVFYGLSTDATLRAAKTLAGRVRLFR